MVAFGGAKTRKRRVKPGRLRKAARGEGGLRAARVGLRLQYGQGLRLARG